MFSQAFQVILYAGGLQDIFAKHWSRGSRNTDDLGRVQTQVLSTCWAVEGAPQAALLPSHRKLKVLRESPVTPTHPSQSHTEATLVHLLF